MPEMRIGWIGLGIMGRPMASNLRRAGFDVVAWNRSHERREAWAADGGRLAATPREVAASADVLVIMVSDTPDVEAVLFGPDGAAGSLREGSVVIDTSTISPSAARGFAERLSGRGVALLDAPVSGGEGGAIAGTLSIMVGGDPEAFGRCRPVFDALGRKVTWMGPSGSGQTTKLCNQVAVFGTLLATCEALTLAEAAGLDPSRLLEAIGGGAARSWQLENLGPKIVAHDFAPGFLVRHARKDLELVREAAAAHGLSLRGTALVRDLFAGVDGDDGTQALAKTVVRREDP